MCAFLKICPLRMRNRNNKTGRLTNETQKKCTSCQKNDLETPFVGTSHNQIIFFCERMVWRKNAFLDILS